MNSTNKSNRFADNVKKYTPMLVGQVENFDMLKSISTVIKNIISMYIPPDILKIHSYDCARKSMGVCCLRVRTFCQMNPTWNLPVLYTSDEYDWMIDNVISIQYKDVWDISDPTRQKGKPPDWSIVSKNLHECIQPLFDTYGSPDVMLYEYQMVQNDKSRTVSHFLIHHYSPFAKIKQMVPTLKNKVHFHADLIHQNFLEKYTQVYRANKMHCAENFKYWCNSFGLSYSHIKKKNMDDIGDAFMQAMAFLCFC